MSVAHAQTLRLRLFIEGVEVPVISAQVTCAPNSPAVAAIQIPPLASATRFYPRSIVHLFFLDLYKSNLAVNTRQTTDSEQRGERNPSLRDRALDRQDATEGASRIDTDLSNHNWKLLFGGEVVGFSWSKNASGARSVVLQCEDWSNYWDYAFQADNTDVFGPGRKAVFSGASTNLFTDFLTSQSEKLTSILTSGRCNTFPQLKGLAAGVIRLIEAIGGSYYTYPTPDNKPPKKMAGQNIFFSYNELRLHLTQMVGTLENDNTGERVLRRQGYSGMFQRVLGSQGGQVSLRQVITALTRIMFYEMYPQACPLYKPGTYGEVSGTKRVKLKDHPTLGGFAGVAESTTRGLQDSVESLNTFLQEDLTSDTAFARFRELVNSELDRLTSIRDTMRVTRSVMNSGVPERVAGQYSAATNYVSRALTSLRRAVTTTAGSSRRKLLVDGTVHLSSAIGSLIGVGDSVIILGGGRDRHPAQLYQQIFKPDTWFAPPPRCNVLFPEQYDSLSYYRMFLQEPTRFLLKTNDEFYGPDELFDKLYFAPKASTVEGSKATLQRILRRGLLDHERFTGILPVFEKMGEFNIFASRAEARQRPGIQKIGLAQRSANFLYFRHRFNARKMTVRGKFNPYVAVGFAGLIIDRYVDQAVIEHHNELRRQANAQDPEGSGRFPEIEIAEILGTNFLGNFTQVVHHVSQDQPMGSTTINVTFARQPEEGVEFLGSIPEELRVKRRLKDADARKSYDIAALSPPHVFSLGPSNGKITNVQDVTGTYDTSGGNIEGAVELPVFFSNTRRDSSFRPPLVPIGVPRRIGDLGSQLLVDQATNGDADAIVTFRAYRITEEIPRYRVEQALLPAEEYIRPGWYGDVWSNAKVGQVYQELVGTGSITDPQAISDFGRNTASAHSEQAQQAAEQKNSADGEDDPRRDAPALLSLDEKASIQQAVEFLQLTYSYVRQAGIDVDEFIGAYTWRPVASMLDIFGTADLQYSNDGEQIVSGFEGFHSRAFGPHENLFGLVSAEIEDVVGVKRGSTAAAKLDIRLARREQVEKYIAQLLFSSAVLG